MIQNPITPEMIDVAADESAAVAALRAKKSKQRRWATHEIARLLQNTAKIKIQFGPCQYVVWNTKPVLLALKKKIDKYNKIPR